MSSAHEKNAQALRSLFGDSALAHRLSSAKLAVVLPAQECSASARLLYAALSDSLARLWPNIDFSGADAFDAQRIARDAAIAGQGPTDSLQVGWHPPYDVVVAIGCDVPEGSKKMLRVGADGWMAELGPSAACGSDDNPIGPAFAAALAAAQVFYHVFSTELSGMDCTPIEQWTGDLRELFSAVDLKVQDIDVGDSHVFGVGAVTHGLVWLMERWPAALVGKLNLVDQDKYGHSNGQRYCFMPPGAAGQLKVDAVKTRLNIAHPGLEVHAWPMDLNSYCASRGYETPLQRAIVGLDSAEARRHAAMKLPTTAINMWTGGERLGAARYFPSEGAACLACDYMEKKEILLDEVGHLHQQTGLEPRVIRDLLDSGRGMTGDEARELAARWQVSAANLVAEPLRSALPLVCATGRLAFPGSGEAVDVPFSFASFFAGIAGFIMLLKDLQAPAQASEGWTQHNFKAPTVHLYSTLHQRADCVRCAMEADAGLI